MLVEGENTITEKVLSGTIHMVNGTLKPQTAYLCTFINFLILHINGTELSFYKKQKMFTSAKAC